MTRRSLSLAAALLIVSACGETVDLAATPTEDNSTTPAPASTVVPDATTPVAELLPLMLDTWLGLDELVVDRDGDAEVLARIEALWRLAEPRLRAERPELLFGFEQSLNLARSAVDRRRPADASKGYKLAVDLTSQYLTR